MIPAHAGLSRISSFLSLACLESLSFIASCGFESYATYPPRRIAREMFYGTHPATVYLIPENVILRVCFYKNPFLKVLSAWLSSWGEKSSKMSPLNQACDFFFPDS